MSNQAERTPINFDDWDRLIDNPFNIGPFTGSIKADDWWVLTGMHVKLPPKMDDRPAGTNKLLVVADTISAPVPRGEVLFDGLSDVLLMGHTLNLGSKSGQHSMLKGDETFRIAIVGLINTNWFHLSMQGGMRGGRNLRSDEFRWYRDRVEPNQIEFSLNKPRPGYDWDWYEIRKLPLPDSGPGFDAACRTFLARLLLTAQYLFDANRPDDADRVLNRLEALLAMNPRVASWQVLAAQCTATREMFEPQLPGSDRVPALSPAVYDRVARSYGPALKAFADKFDRFVDRSSDIAHRRQAANLLLRQEDDAIRFQALVTEQLEENLKAATANLARAQTSMESQTKRVEDAERAFQAGLGAWQREQRRQAALAITGAVFSAVVGVAMIFAGKPMDVTSLAEKAKKAGELAVKIVETVKKLEKIVKAVARLLKLVNEILPHVSRLISAGPLAARMAEVRREADASDLNGAPSESAYWDQFWVETEMALAPALGENVPGAADYLQQLKILIIYGRALTAAQAAILPVAQELAQATLLAKIAEEQREATTQQIQTLETSTTSAGLAVALWLRHRSVRRAVFAALLDFDAAHRYWALTAERPRRDPSRPITDLAEDLLAIADIEVSVQRALASFDPSPQDFTRVSFQVPATAVADFLRDGSFALRFTPDFGPVADWGRVGRVRVQEVAVWIIWSNDKRPRSMEFTIRTDGDYYDQRVQSGEVKEFRFVGPRVNRTFRYDPVKADRSREESIAVRARVAEDFRAQYSEPTLFTGWQFSLPRNAGVINRETIEALRGAVKGIEVEFSGNFIKDAERFF